MNVDEAPKIYEMQLAPEGRKAKLQFSYLGGAWKDCTEHFQKSVKGNWDYEFRSFGVVDNERG